MSEALDYIQQSTAEQRKLFQLSRSVIINSSPRMVESFAYKVPFYSIHYKICYLNRLKKGIDIGFVRGNELSDPHGILSDEGRKMVKSIRLFSREEFNEDILRETVQEAIILDEFYHKRKQK